MTAFHVMKRGGEAIDELRMRFKRDAERRPTRRRSNITSVRKSLGRKEEMCGENAKETWREMAQKQSWTKA